MLRMEGISGNQEWQDIYKDEKYRNIFAYTMRAFSALSTVPSTAL